MEEVTSIYLYLAIYYERENNKWLWLAYELYTFAMDTCKCYNKDQGLTEATVRYMLGRLCFFRSKIHLAFYNSLMKRVYLKNPRK